MAAAVAGNDIDSFIREQKAKLALERNALDSGGESRQSEGSVSRRQWDRQGGQDTRLAVEESRPRTQEGGLPLTNATSSQKQRQLAEQRRQEYNQIISKDREARPALPEDEEEISNPSIIPFTRAQEDQARKRRMEQERQREYQQVKAKLDEKHRRGRSRETSDRERLGSGTRPVDQRAPGRGSLLEQTDEYKANLPGRNDSDLAKMEKERQRNEEYKQFLRENDTGRRTRLSDKGESSDFYATLPGLRDSHSAKARKEQQRNREYNDFLASRSSQRDAGKPPAAPRKGWATPTYQDMLDRKREEEAQYRRAHDPGYGQPLESRENREPLDLPRNISPAQLPPRTREGPRGDNSEYYATLPLGSNDSTRASRSQQGPVSSADAKRRQKEQYRDELQKQMREAEEARRREKQSGRNINYAGEKAQNLKANYSGYRDPEERRAAHVAAPAPTPSRLQHHAPSAASTYLEGLDRLDRLNTRSDLLSRQRIEDAAGTGGGLLEAPLSLSRAGGGGGGLLDSGFSSILQAPRLSHLAPPPGLEYQPASYITNGSSSLGQTSVEDAYNFYASHNPLDTTAAASGAGLSRPLQPSQDRAYADTRLGGGGGGFGGGGLSARDGAGAAARSRVRFEDEVPRQRHLANMDFPTDKDKKKQSQMKAQAYQEELHRQIEEKKRKKLIEKEEKERYDRKLEQEAQSYNPYGRGGGGAPMRDAYGNIVSDLRSMRRDTDNPDRPPPPPQQQQQPPSFASAYAPTRDDLIGPPPVQTTADGEQSHARGGHGIFGMPKTSEEKVASERYKDELRRQIEERRREEMRKKEMERLEEEKEQKRLDEQHRRMQLEYEEEQRKIKEKEDEARRKNEELVRQAEERKREAEQRRKEAEERTREEARREKEAEMNARLATTSERGKSPVIPALRHKTQDNEGAAREGSPPIPAARTRAADEEPQQRNREDPAPLSRAPSADVLNQLAAMRKQLQNERQRVEDMLQTEKKAPDVFDPRLMQKPAAVKPEVDVFETARHGNAVAVRRTPADRGNAQALEDFNALRHKEDSDSRKEFRKAFPDHPSSGDTLEAQQAALLRQQEQSLQALREQRENEQSGYSKPSFPPRSARAQSRTPHQLNSNSAFVDVDSLNYFPDDFDDMPGSRRNESARARRRNRHDSSPRPGSRGRVADPFGSTPSLNVDRLSKKNEDRLKRLQEMQGDDMSLFDPDDVLDRFMSKQAHNRPPSGQTLQDDSWMFAGATSKASGY